MIFGNSNLVKFFKNTFSYQKSDLFRLCPPPQLNGCILFAPPDARALFLHKDLLCNGTCSVTGGRITYGRGGSTNGKDPKSLLLRFGRF